MQSQGVTGRGGREYGPRDPVVLNGVRASEWEPKVYPDDICEQCLNAGVIERAHCFRNHWRGGKNDRPVAE